MRLIFVHGIRHEGKSSEWVKAEWREALCRSVSAADASLIRSLSIDAPFYGDLLHATAREREEASD